MIFNLKFKIKDLTPKSYVDEAMGFFSKGMDILERVKPILCNIWPGEIEPEPEYAWESVWSEGLIDAETACAWRAEVFGLNDEEMEEQET